MVRKKKEQQQDYCSTSAWKQQEKHCLCSNWLFLTEVKCFDMMCNRASDGNTGRIWNHCIHPERSEWRSLCTKVRKGREQPSRYMKQMQDAARCSGKNIENGKIFYHQPGWMQHPLQALFKRSTFRQKNGDFLSWFWRA